jgi:hypothetical protein
MLNLRLTELSELFIDDYAEVTRAGL